MDQMQSREQLANEMCEQARQLILDGDCRQAESLLRQAIGTDMACFSAYRYLEYLLDERQEYGEATRLHYFMRFIKLGLVLYPFMKSDIFDPASEFAEIILDQGFAERISNLGRK
jgi:hypothetical protein